MRIPALRSVVKALGLGFISFALFSYSYALAQPDSSRATGFRLLDLGTLGGDASGAWAIDANGHVAGWSTTALGERRAFITCDGCDMQNTGTLVGGSDSFATALSASGEWMAGYGGINDYGPGFAEFRQGFIYDGAMQAVGSLYCPCTFNIRHGTSEAHGVNDLGHVVGFAPSPFANYYHAFVWKEGMITDLSTTGLGEPSYSQAFDINNSGQIVGFIAHDDDFSFEDSGKQPFVWEDEVFTLLENLSGYAEGSAVAINEKGHVVGWSGDDEFTGTTATGWADGNVYDLGKLAGDENSRALALNDMGQVVGWSGTVEYESRAFFWQDGIMLDMNSLLPPNSDWILLEARAINDRGMIAGTGLKGGEMRAFLIKPPSIAALRNLVHRVVGGAEN